MVDEPTDSLSPVSPVCVCGSRPPTGLAGVGQCRHPWAGSMGRVRDGEPGQGEKESRQRVQSCWGAAREYGTRAAQAKASR